jgi:hypothetical protein
MHRYQVAKYVIFDSEIYVTVLGRYGLYRVIHERGISEFLFTATHCTHCNNILI